VDDPFANAAVDDNHDHPVFATCIIFKLAQRSCDFVRRSQERADGLPLGRPMLNVTWAKESPST
jgi:hypothetical protein